MLKLSKQIKSAKKILQIYYIKQRLKRSKITVKLTGLGAGSKFYGKVTTLDKIIRKSSSPMLKSIFWAFIIKKCNGTKFLELGTNIGLNACIIRLISGKKTVTIEGEKNLSKIAQKISSLLQIDITIINAAFDNVLTEILITYKPNIILIDGDHSSKALNKYLNNIFNNLTYACIIIDDINWSKDMRKFWQNIQNPSITTKISLIKFGIIIFKKMC